MRDAPEREGMRNAECGVRDSNPMRSSQCGIQPSEIRTLHSELRTPLALDIEDPKALLDYLREKGHVSRSESPRFTNLRGGVSNRTVLVERSDDRNFVLKQALEKLRVQVDWRS